jgi:hypothetical protein
MVERPPAGNPYCSGFCAGKIQKTPLYEQTTCTFTHAGFCFGKDCQFFGAQSAMDNGDNSDLQLSVNHSSREQDCIAKLHLQAHLRPVFAAHFSSAQKA